MIQGVDLSKYQKTNDKLEMSGLGFAYIKATEGTHTDPMLSAHSKNIGDSHLLRGHYHFYRDNVNPVVQAQAFFTAIKPYMDDFSLPPCIDLEDTNAAAGLNDRVKQFLDQLEELSGIVPMVYTYKPYYISHVLNIEPKHELWLACYEKNPNTPFGPWESPKFWQYSGKSKIEGETALVDGDFFMGNPIELFALTGSHVDKNGYTPDEWQTNNYVKIW